jgi:hypothetical protein
MCSLRPKRSMDGIVEESSEAVVITGAFSYTGKYATRFLLSRGYRVRTLTYHPERANPFGEKVQVFSYRGLAHPFLRNLTPEGALPFSRSVRKGGAFNSPPGRVPRVSRFSGGGIPPVRLQLRCAGSPHAANPAQPQKSLTNLRH